MIQQVKHISANTKTELEQLKKEIAQNFEKYDIIYSIIDSDWNSDKNGYKAQVNYWN